MNRGNEPCLKGFSIFYFMNSFIWDTPMECISYSKHFGRCCGYKKKLSLSPALYPGGPCSPHSGPGVRGAEESLCVLRARWGDCLGLPQTVPVLTESPGEMDQIPVGREVGLWSGSYSSVQKRENSG